MDNRLTKKRLSDFLSYEWIITVIAVVAALLLWEMIFSVSATRLSVGQNFKYYLDQNLYSFDDNSVYGLLGVDNGKNGKTFSYEVLQVDEEGLFASYNVLSVRLSVQEGDAIFTSSFAAEDETVRAKEIIDAYSICDLNELLLRAKEYLKQFTLSGDVYNQNDYDESKIADYFDARTKGDKRFKTEEDKKQGRKDEIGRIKKLAVDTSDFEKILTGGKDELFFRYIKYEQLSGGDENNENYGALYKKEKDKGELVYGLNMGALTGGKAVSDYLRTADDPSAKDVVLLLFDFAAYQPDLQFEEISFTVTLVREFSDILG